MAVVVLDAGHGSQINGASALGLREEDIVLSVAWKVARILDKTSRHIVALTRPFRRNLTTGSVARDLRLRAELANKIKADRFVSIHCNVFNDPSVGGFEVWYHDGSEKGKAFAERVCKALAFALPNMRNRGVKNDKEQTKSGYQVLRQTSMPAILVELGFLSCPADAEILKVHKGQWEIAKALASAITAELNALS